MTQNHNFFVVLTESKLKKVADLFRWQKKGYVHPSANGCFNVQRFRESSRFWGFADSVGFADSGFADSIRFEVSSARLKRSVAFGRSFDLRV